MLRVWEGPWSFAINSFGNCGLIPSQRRMSSTDMLSMEGKFPNSSSKHNQPSNPMKRTWSTDSLTNTGSSIRTCCCAPTTHAGSFRCRLHRLSNVHTQTAPLPPPPPPPSMSTTAASRTVEAQ